MTPAGTPYVERLWPGALGWSLVPAAGLAAGVVLLPADPVAALVGGVVALVAAAATAVVTSTPVVVADGELRVGRARIPVTVLGEPGVLDRAGVRGALGPGSDARTFVCVRGWIGGAVLVPVDDPEDPTPAWFVSTRRPEGLASAIRAARQAHSVQTS